MKMYRQGDVLVRSIAALPATATEVANIDRIVLAWGEVTGHAHAIAVNEAREFTHTDAGNVVRRFLHVFDKGTSLHHEEHATIPLPPGFYEIVQQREYTPEAVRNVVD